MFDEVFCGEAEYGGDGNEICCSVLLEVAMRNAVSINSVFQTGLDLHSIIQRNEQVV